MLKVFIEILLLLHLATRAVAQEWTDYNVHDPGLASLQQKEVIRTLVLTFFLAMEDTNDTSNHLENWLMENAVESVEFQVADTTLSGRIAVIRDWVPTVTGAMHEQRTFPSDVFIKIEGIDGESGPFPPPPPPPKKGSSNSNAVAGSRRNAVHFVPEVGDEVITAFVRLNYAMHGYDANGRIVKRTDDSVRFHLLRRRKRGGQWKLERFLSNPHDICDVTCAN